jgi:hypothetical protein
VKEKFKFNSAKHEYTVDGCRVISTTDVLGRMGFVDFSGVNPHVLEEAAAIGTGVSEATALLDKGKSWTKYAALSGYVRAWIAFKKAWGFKPKLIEKPLYCSSLMYATTPDRYGYSKLMDANIVVQIKTCPVKDWVGLQVASEEYMIRKHLGRDRNLFESTRNRFAVEIKPDGKFKERQFVEANDIRVFFAALTCEKWKVNHGYKKLP